jgi:hypothetical protein
MGIQAEGQKRRVLLVNDQTPFGQARCTSARGAKLVHSHDFRTKHELEVLLDWASSCLLCPCLSSSLESAKSSPMHMPVESFFT